MRRPSQRRPNQRRGPAPLRADGGHPRSPRRAGSDDASDRLLAAQEHLAAGRDRAALAQAGEAVRCDPRRPEGYVLLGEIHLGRGEIGEAREAFVQGARKSRRGPELHPMLPDALGGVARCDLLTGAFEQAAGSLGALLDLDPDDRGTRQLLGEVQLLLGRPAATLDTLAPSIGLPDADIVRGLALLELGRPAEASEAIRRALLGNFYLPAYLVGSEPADHGVLHGTEEAEPGFAEDLADRIRTFLDDRPNLLDTFARIATTPTIMHEVSCMIGLAQALNREQDPALRSRLIARVGDLRNPIRIRAGTDSVLAELEAEEREPT